MRGEIRRICREAGLTAIYVTHDQKEALSIADRMAVLEQGRIRQTGTPAEVYRQPATRFVADFMGETNFLAAKVLEVIDGHARVESMLGTFDAAIDGTAVGVGDSVTLSIRPEAWKLGTEQSTNNRVRGKLRERIYLGEMAQYRFAPTADPAHELKIFELNPRFVNAGRDEELYASADPSDIVLLQK
jgi:iron(III) transport system ATP-binding protein